MSEELKTHIIKKFNEITSDNESILIEKNINDFVVNFCKEKLINNTFFNNLYIEKSRQLYNNLKKDSYVNNTQIHNLLQKKKLNLEKIAFYSYKNLFPSKWKKFNKDLEILNKDISDFNKEVQATDAFTCNKCKKNKCVYSQFQIRSADEPMTLFITCLNPKCGNSWRE